MRAEKDAVQQQRDIAVASLSQLRAEKEAAQRTSQQLEQELAALNHEKEAMQHTLLQREREAAALRVQLEQLRNAAPPNAALPQLHEQVAMLKKALAAEHRHGAISSAFLAVRDLSEFEVVQRLGVGSFAMVVKCRPRDGALARLVPEVAIT